MNKKTIIYDPMITSLPDVYSQSSNKRQILLLCCDGIYEKLSMKQIATRLKLTYFKNKLYKNVSNVMAEDLVEYAFESGSKDNLSCYVILLDE